MRIKFVFLLPIIALLFNAAPNFAQQDTSFDCPDTLPPRLTVGYLGRVLPGDANRIRDEPSLAGESLGFIPGEGEFKVYGGPVCADGYVWWQVYYEERGEPGFVWTVEGSSDEYWLEPLYVPNTIRDYDYRGIAFQHGHGTPHGSTIQVGTADTENTVDAVEIVIDSWLRNYMDSGERATITIIPLEDYRALSDSAANEVDALLTMLDTRTFPDDLEVAPFIPVSSRNQPYQVLPEFLDFQNGSGVRYLTTPVNNYVVVTNTAPSYTFMGVTEDGSQLISVTLPLYVPILPEVSEEGLPYATDDDGSTYTQYLLDVEAQLESATVDDFEPFLPVLDAMMESLVVNLEPPAPPLELSPDEVTYTLPPSVAESLDGRRLNQEPFAQFTDEESPAVLSFEFEGEQFNSDWNQILIYPVPLTEEMNLRNFDDLAETLANRPTPIPITIGPRINAGMPLYTRAEYIDFENGSGIRYIAHITQDYTPVSPLYIFTGLTDDGLHYVEMVYFVRSELLEFSDVTQTFYDTPFEEVSTAYGDYIDGAAEILDTADADSFTPSLDDVDEFVRSLHIGGE